MQNIQIFITESRGKKGGRSKASSNRSALLKAIMPHLSGNAGDELAESYVSGDKEKVKSTLIEVIKKVVGGMK